MLLKGEVVEVNNILQLCGLLVIAIGWLISYRSARLRDQKIEEEKQKILYLNEQLSKFYGPIYSLLLENDRIRLIIQKQMGRDVIFPVGHSLTKDELKIWTHYLENFLIPNNRLILNTIENNVHLIQGVRFPEEYLDWIDHAIGYELLHKQYLDIGKEYGFYSIINFPKEFRESIVNSISQLKKRQQELVKIDLPSPFEDK